MSHRRSSPVIALTLLLALVAAPKTPADSFRTDPILAQAPAAPAFNLPESVASDTIVKIDGSTSLQTINQLLKQRFQQQYSGTQVEDRYSGTDAALQAVLDGNIDLAAIGRPLTDAEKAQGLSAVPIARHKIAILIGPDNPYAGDISYQQFARIFRGEITDWSELGGSPGPIRFVDRPDSSDTRLAFNNYPVFQSAPFQTGENAVKSAEDTTDAVIQQLGTDGISFSIADQALDRQDVKIVPMHKTLPTDPRYPFSQPLTYVYRGSPNPAVLAFLGFATDASNRQAIEQARASEATQAAAIPPVGAASPTISPSAISPSSPSVAADSPAVSSSETPAALDPAIAPAAAPISSANDWLPWLLLLLLGGLGLLFWALKGRQRQASPLAQPPAAPVPVPPVAPTPLSEAAWSEPPALSPSFPVGASGAEAALGAGALAAGIGAAGIGAAIWGASRPESRIILTPRNSEQAYAYWETPEAHKAELRRQGGEALKLRIYDVTDIDLDSQAPHSVLQYDCAETDQDRHVPIPESDRDYLAEIGYVTPENRWLMLARSASVRVPPAPVAEPMLEPQSNGLGLGALAGGAAVAAAGLGALLPEPSEPEPIPPSRIVLTPRSFEDAYAYWETPEAAKAALRRQGGEHLTLLLSDVTGLDLATQVPYNVQRFNCAETETDRHVPIPMGDRDYIAEIGYLTSDNQWLLLARSEPIRVPAMPPVDAAESIDALLVEAEPVAAESAIMTADAGGSDIAEVQSEPSPEAGYAFLTMPQYANGDRSPAATGFDLEPADLNGEDLASVDADLPDLPAGYGESRITLMARDPHWAYAYWDILPEDWTEVHRAGVTSLALRFYDVTDVNLEVQNPHSLQQYHCDELARDWYIPVPVSDRDYIVEIGYVTGEGNWSMLARSIPVRIPPVYPSDWYEEKFTTVPWEEEIRTRVFQGLEEPYRRSEPEDPAYDRFLKLAEVFQEQRVSGSLFGSMQQVPQAIVSSFMFPSGLGIPGAITESGVGMSGIGMSGIGMSGIGMSGVGLAGMSGVGIYSMSGLGLAGMSGIDLSGMGLAGMSGIGLYSMSGLGRAGMSGIGMSGVGLAGMSGVGLYSMSGLGLASLSGVGMYSMSGVGMSGVGMYSMSGVGMSGMGLYSMSGVGMSGVGMYSMSGVGMSGVGMTGIGMAGLSGVGLAGLSGVGMYTTSGMGRMSGVGLYSMSGLNDHGTSGMGFANTSGMGMMSGTGLANLSGAGLYSLSGIGLYGTSGVGMYSMSGIGMSGIGMSGIGLSATPDPQPRKFWLIADAELIVHGATEPDATVTIAGQTVRLNPDGTFRFQVMFPDGNFDYPILAVAADGEQNRAIHMKFSRETPVRRVNTKDAAVNEWVS